MHRADQGSAVPSSSVQDRWLALHGPILAARRLRPGHVPFSSQCCKPGLINDENKNFW
jgi:hypothetical protein